MSKAVERRHRQRPQRHHPRPLHSTEQPVRLDFACGNNKRDGFHGVDVVKTPSVDTVLDLLQTTWPWPDNSVDEIHCSHFVEHLNGDDMIRFMNHCHRILKPKATMNVIAPYFSSMRAWQDPTHKQAISEASFLYYNREWRIQNRLDHYPITADFDFTYGYAMVPEWAMREESARTFAIRHYMNVVQDIHVVLTKREAVA